MTRTKRAYNRHPIGGGYSGPTYHPFWQLCMGHCRICKRQHIENARRRKRREKELTRSEIEGGMI